MNENRFDGMGKIYSRFRPSYPQEFIDCLFSEIGMNKDSVIADVGSGTGILTGQLLSKGCRVYAVEPNNDMRAAAEKNLKGFSNFVSVNGTAENTTLADSSVDYITVAQAFHWFDRQVFKRECKRILKPGGSVILVWNSRDAESEFVQENDKLNRKYCPSFKGFIGGMRGAVDEGDFSDFFSGRFEARSFENHLQFDEQGFIGRNLSSSYALKETDGNYSEYVFELKKLFEKYKNGETVVMPNFARCYIGKV